MQKQIDKWEIHVLHIYFVYCYYLCSVGCWIFHGRLKAQLKGKYFFDNKKKNAYERIVNGQCIVMGKLKRKKANELGFSHLGLNLNKNCRNPSFGLATKAKGLRGCGLRGSSVFTSHTPENVRKCEGVWESEHPHSQSNSHFGRWSLGQLPKFQRAISGVKNQCLVAFFIFLESFEM
jgi:hypothetical protein